MTRTTFNRQEEAIDKLRQKQTYPHCIYYIKNNSGRNDRAAQ